MKPSYQAEGVSPPYARYSQGESAAVMVLTVAAHKKIATQAHRAALGNQYPHSSSASPTALATRYITRYSCGTMTTCLPCPRSGKGQADPRRSACASARGTQASERERIPGDAEI